jgi:hypothetical protein
MRREREKSACEVMDTTELGEFMHYYSLVARTPVLAAL